MMINPEAVTQEIECPKEHPFLLCLPNHGRSFPIPHEVKRISCDKPIHKSFYTDGQTHGSKYFSSGLEPQGAQSQVPGRTPRHCLAFPPWVRLQVELPKTQQSPGVTPSLLLQSTLKSQNHLQMNSFGCTQTHLHLLWCTSKPPPGVMLTIWEWEDRMDAGVQLGQAFQQRGIVLDVQRGGAAGATQGTRGVHVTAAACQAATVGLQGHRGQSHPAHTQPGTAHTKHSFIFFDVTRTVKYKNTYCSCI